LFHGRIFFISDRKLAGIFLENEIAGKVFAIGIINFDPALAVILSLEKRQLIYDVGKFQRL
jgi:hypothetical protein